MNNEFKNNIEREAFLMKKSIKRIFLSGLTCLLVMGMAVTGMAGSAESVEEFSPTSDARAYFDAYCGYSSGSASTSVYGDAYTTWAMVYVSMDMYIIDSDLYEKLNKDDMDEYAELFDSVSDSSSDYYNAMAIIDIETNGASMGSGENYYHGYKVESEHEAVTNLNNSNSVSDSLVAEY